MHWHRPAMLFLSHWKIRGEILQRSGKRAPCNDLFFQPKEMIFFFFFLPLSPLCFFPDKEQMYLWQCSPPTPGSTHPSTLMLSTSAGFFLRSFAVEFTCCILFLSRFLTWAFHIFFYDIAYEPEGWPWKPVSIFVSSSLSTSIIILKLVLLLMLVISSPWTILF